MDDSLRSLGEFGLIERLTAGAADAGEGVVLGVGDDCAVVDDGAGDLLLLTTDLMAEGVHFLIGVDPVELGDKLLSVNLSDVAAMGGVPRHAVLAVAIPAELGVAFLDGLYRGLLRRAARHGVTLVGGDTTRSRSGLVLSLALTGRAERGRVLLRAAARPGDRVLVSGTLGDAAAGLELLDAGGEERMPAGGLTAADATFLRRRHALPEPRVDLGPALAALDGVHAAIDLSDGLASDLRHVCNRSGVGALIEVDRLPLSGPLRRYASTAGIDAFDLAVGGGEDYELCVTADAAIVGAMRLVAASRGTTLTDVGEIVRGEPSIRWIAGDGSDVDPVASGWDHFA